MKRILLLAVAVSALIGCSENKITVTNEASEAIVFHFRTGSDTVLSGSTVEITDIPNATFAYSTTYIIPPNATSHVADGELGGTLSFAYDEAEYLIYYSSIFTPDSVYEIYAVVNSTLPVESGVN